MKEPTDQPRLVFRDGYWRVSPLPDRSARNEQLAHANQLFALRAHLWSLMMQPGVIESLLDAYHVLETQVLAKSIEDSIHSMGDPAAPETDPDLLQAAEAAASRLLNQTESNGN